MGSADGVEVEPLRSLSLQVVFLGMAGKPLLGRRLLWSRRLPAVKSGHSHEKAASHEDAGEGSEVIVKMGARGAQRSSRTGEDDGRTGADEGRAGGNTCKRSEAPKQAFVRQWISTMG